MPLSSGRSLLWLVVVVVAPMTTVTVVVPANTIVMAYHPTTTTIIPFSSYVFSRPRRPATATATATSASTSVSSFGGSFFPRLDDPPCRHHHPPHHYHRRCSVLLATAVAADEPAGAADAHNNNPKRISPPTRRRWEKRLILNLFIAPLQRLLAPFFKWLMGIFLQDLDRDGTVLVVDNDVVLDDNNDEAVQTNNENVDDEKVLLVMEESTSSASSSPLSKGMMLADNIDEDAKPLVDRWAVSAPQIDLTGKWQLVVTDDFKVDYDAYLKKLGQKLLVREVALAVAGQTTEELVQMDHGRSLLLRSTNLRGTWTRTLVASGMEDNPDEDDQGNDQDYEPLIIPITSADAETVQAESWWEKNGTQHVSWMRGVTKYGGGSFESRRYLEDGGDVYVCESAFHPTDPKKAINRITWRFQRQNTDGQ